LIPEFAIKFWIHAFAAMIDVKALTAPLTKPCLKLLTGSNGFTIRMVSAPHFSSFSLIIPNFIYSVKRELSISYIFFIDLISPFWY